MKLKFTAALIALALLIQGFGAVPGSIAAQPDQTSNDPVSTELTDQLTSPDGHITAYIGLNNAGKVRYTVQRDGKTVICESSMGLTEAADNFSDGFTKSEFSAVREVDESYSLLTGKYSTYQNHYNTAELSLKSTGNADFTVELRMYNDGFAFRYKAADSQVDSFHFTDELSEFCVQNDWTVWHSKYYSNSYEVLYTEDQASALDDQTDYYNSLMPLLYQTGNDDYVLISEANLSGEYTGSVIHPNIGEDGVSLKVSFTPSQTTAVESDAPFESPWRYAVIGDLSAITENTMAENLSDDPDPAVDYSYVTAGASSWSWLEQGLSSQSGAQHDEAKIKEYIDLSAQMGWEYCLLDEGWQQSTNPPEYYDFFDEIMDYAKSKHVKIIVWVHSGDLATEQQRNERLEKWAASGVSGIKVDFFDNENQDTLKLYEAIYQKCAELKMVVNCHGANKSTGETRTYPNVLTREGIRGQEFGNITANDFVTLGYTRLATGVADITEYVAPRSSALTAGFQLALSFITCSGIHTFAGSPDEYASQKATEIYQGWSGKFDDTKFLCGEVGTSIGIARKSGDIWYAAAMANTAYTADFSLDFLDDGNYLATVYNDGSTYNDLTTSAKVVTKNDVLSIDIMSGGGFVVKLQKLDGSVKGLSSVALSGSDLRVETGNELALETTVVCDTDAVNDLSYASSDERVAVVSENGTVTGKAVGKTVIKAYSALDPSVYDTVEVIVTLPQYQLNKDIWSVANPINDNIKVVGDRLIISMTPGEPGTDTSIKNWFQTVPKDDNFEISVKISGGLYADCQTVALYAMADSNNLVAAMRRYHSGLVSANGLSSPNCFEILRYEHGYSEPAVDDPQNSADAWLKLVKSGDVYTSYYSYDGISWIVIGSQTVTGTLKDAEAADLKIGIYTAGGSDSAPADVFVSDFQYKGEGDTDFSSVPLVKAIDYSSVILKGDADADKQVTVSDVVTLRGLIMSAGGWSDFQFMSADLNADYSLTVSDVVELRDYIMKGDFD